MANPTVKVKENGSHLSGTWGGAQDTAGATGGSHQSGTWGGPQDAIDDYYIHGGKEGGPPSLDQGGLMDVTAPGGTTTSGGHGGSHWGSGSGDPTGSGGLAQPLPGTSLPSGGGQPASQLPGTGHGGVEYIPGLGWIDTTPSGPSGGGSGGTGPSPEDLLGEQLGGGGEGSGGEGGEGSGSGGSGPSMIQGSDPKPYQLPELEGPNPERLEHVSTEDLRGMLQQLIDAQKQQSEGRIDRGVQQGIDALNRALEDAAQQYQTQRDQVTAEEMRAKDNQALYAEARGDRGGIGQAQYDAIQNTAAQNRRAVNDAQVKLGTDTARQIEDLRAQGEFEKADQLLSITQSHLSQLMQLEQWALQTNLGVDEFNSQLQQWVDQFNLQKQQYLSDLELAAAQMTGLFSDGTRTQAAQQQLIQSLASSGNILIQAGIMPSRQQLEAMGLTELQAREYLKKMGVQL